MKPLDDDVEYLDLGLVQIPLLFDPEIRLNIDQESMLVVGFAIIIGSSMAEVQLFARAKDELLWPEVRDDLVRALTEQGIQHEVVIGEFGSEVRTVMPLQDIDGNNVLQSVRFVGVDGDRWFLRAAISGAAAVSEIEINQMDQLIANIKVERGIHPMPPGELMTFSMPEFGE